MNKIIILLYNKMPKWLPPTEMCNKGINSRWGHKMEFQKCDEWANGDVNDCYNNPPPGTVGWQTCGIGSSPSGKEQGHTAIVCSEPTETFSCAWGQNCYAITKKELNEDCVIHEIMFFSASCCCCIILMVLLMLVRGR